MNWTAKDDTGRADKSMLEGAVTEIWNATSSPTFTSDVQKTTIESTVRDESINQAQSLEYMGYIHKGSDSDKSTTSGSSGVGGVDS